eukprot:CAMPEP_0170562620 /NCGR_PEP_ID=MMETSP0211-20121228/61567_1 /TAXON_ID=311385 /ORGANISM="Pseudokeronopsis sp., Strain OXSARD2" /LENGTH=73 /DNA_ID=CAMNT_0010879729 /DNA_START=291 /DNA_END=509 /DNA_ORIENTATION=-
MSYEQLLELGDRLGKVSKGLSQKQISKFPAKVWRPGVTSTNECAICYEEFVIKQIIKKMPLCGHEYHDSCIGK